MDKALDPVIECPLVYPGEAESAKGYAVRAETAAERAEKVVGGLDSLQGLVDAAAASATAAAGSATAASASETASKNSAEAAAGSADAAASSAEGAESSKEAAASSAQAAKESADAAKEGADDAADSAEAAQNSATAAAGSSATAGLAEEGAKKSANAAAGSATTASEEAGKSAASAAAAEKSRQGASKSEAGAADSAEAAAKSEENAKQSADTLAESVENVVANTAAVAELKEKKAEIDDTAVGANSWSSKHIIDMLCPPLEESGNPVACYPVAGYPLGVKAKWEPMQEGSGTPYPAGGGKQLLDINKCVASSGKPYGMTITLDGDVFKVSGVPNEEVTPTDNYSFTVCTCYQEELRGKGYKVTAWAIKGKVNYAWGLRTESEDSLAISAKLTPGVNNDIRLRLMVSKDTPTAWEPYENIRPIKGRDAVTVTRCGENLLNIAAFSLDVDKNIRTYKTKVQQLIPPGKYTLKVTHTNQNSGLGMQLFTRDGNRITTTSGGTFNLDGILDDIYFYITNVSGNADSIKDIMLIPGAATAPTTYTPYVGATNTLTLPETVYGGEVDAVTGNGVKTKRTMNFMVNSNDIANIPASAGRLFVSVYQECSSVGMRSNPKNEICNILPWVDFDSIVSDTSPVDVDTCVMWGAGSSFGIALNKAYIGLTDESTDDDVVKAAINFIESLPVPVQICYTLAEPVPFTATGAQPLPALAGVNTVLTDADSATVTGRADPIKRITDLEDAVASQT